MMLDRLIPFPQRAVIYFANCIISLLSYYERIIMLMR